MYNIIFGFYHVRFSILLLHFDFLKVFFSSSSSSSHSLNLSLSPSFDLWCFLLPSKTVSFGQFCYLCFMFRFDLSSILGWIVTDYVCSVSDFFFPLFLLLFRYLISFDFGLLDRQQLRHHISIDKAK